MTPYLEIGGDYREVVPGIHMLELPLPFSLGIVNVWLVRLESGWLLIDTGMQTEACFDALARALEASRSTGAIFAASCSLTSTRTTWAWPPSSSR